MSGPKVVRVVTREEIEAIRRRQIHLFEEAAEELRRVAKRHEVHNEAFEADPPEEPDIGFTQGDWAALQDDWAWMLDVVRAAMEAGGSGPA